MKINLPEELGGSGGKYLSEAGTYHLAVNEVYDGVTAKGTSIEGFIVDFQVLDGTTEGQAGKMLNLAFFSPKLNHKEGAQRIALQAQTAFLIATNLIDPADLGKSVEIDLSAASGSQVVAKLNLDEYNGESRLRLNYSDVWHVDDPRAKDAVKDADSIAIIPAEHRKGESSFAAMVKPKPNVAESRISQDDLSDL